MWAVIVAAGSGSRFGGPKQFEMLSGKRVLDWSLDTARELCDGVVLVVDQTVLDRDEPLVDHMVAGGATRSASVRAGLAVLPPDCDIVLIHDAARPLADPALWRRVIDGVRFGADAAVPAVPVVDTLRAIGGTAVDRSRYVAVQTPQGFDLSVLRQAHASGADASDDASLIDQEGGSVVLVDGAPTNLKITTRTDLIVAAALIANQALS